MKVLAIGAHFDDIELGCGGALAKHVASGDKVFAYVATLSGFTNHRKEVIRTNKTAQEEGKRAIKLLGAELIQGSFKTLQIEFNDDLNVDMIKILEKNRIDLVYTHWLGDIHRDHHILAKAAMHCCRHIPRLLMYRSNWYHSTLDFKENFYVDITEFWAIKQKAIEAHKSEMDRTGCKWIEFFRNEAENAGQRIGVRYAEVFEMVKWLN